MKEIILAIIACWFSCIIPVQGQDVQNSLHFDGVNDYAQSSYQGIAGTQARTVEAWIKTTANADPNNGGLQKVICDWGTFVTGGRFTFNVLWNNAIRLEVGGNGVSGTIPVNDGQWHHVAGVYDPSAVNKVKLYVDGVLDTEGNFTVTMNTVLGTDVRLGRRVDDVNFFQGQIDEVRVWGLARSQEDIAADMNAEFCDLPQALQLYYTCNQGEPGGLNVGENTLVDGSGFGNDASLINFNLFGVSSNYLEGAQLGVGITTTDIQVDACESYYWDDTDVTYTESGEYSITLTSINDCDSVVNLDLNIHLPQETNEQVLACETFFWDATGLDYDQSGEYMVTLEDAFGCDSTVTLNLQLGEPSLEITSLEACDSLTWTNGATYYESGTYTDSLTNIFGCDSISILTLTIDQLDDSATDLGSGMLQANQEGANYQWLDCNDGLAEIVGETGQQFEAQESGSYAVLVWTDICDTDTSDCVDVVITDLNDFTDAGISIFPNPAFDFVQIQSYNEVLQVFVWDLNGKLMDASWKKNKQLLNLKSLSPGIYIIEIATIKGIVRERILKH